MNLYIDFLIRLGLRNVIIPDDLGALIKPQFGDG